MWYLWTSRAYASASSRCPIQRFFLAVIVSLMGVMCKDSNPPESLEKSEPIEVSISVMPNIHARIPNTDSVIPIEGSWYWYVGPGVTTTITSITAQSDNSAEMVWYDDTDPPTDISTASNSDALPEKICIEGTVDSNQFLGLGFELCSPQNGDPKELPRILAQCGNAIHKKFRGIEFDISNDDYEKLRVEFRKWGGEDNGHPSCEVIGAVLDYEDYNGCYWKGKTDDEGGETITVKASALDIGNINLNMLQQINIQIYGNNRVDTTCLSNVRVLVEPDEYDMRQYKGETDTEFVVGFDTDTTFKFDVLPVIDAGWISIPESNSITAKSVMKNEVTVEQYQNWIGLDSELEWKWEGCTVHRFFETNEGIGKSANCISWYRAKAFCNWVGGRLPTEAEWNYVFKTMVEPTLDDDKNISCENAVLKDTTKAGTGDGCGVKDSNPAAGCSSPTNTGILCDMIGNLWEWVDGPEREDNILTSEPACEGFEMLKGLGFSSDPLTIGNDDTFSELTTCEHPGVPRNPLKIGFRCVSDENEVENQGGHTASESL